MKQKEIQNEMAEDEYADLEEIERVVLREMFEPVLMLPEVKEKNSFRRDMDERGGMDFGAFGTVDFERVKPVFDKARYKVEKLKEEIANTRILFDITFKKITAKAKYKVLKYVGRGIIDVDDIVPVDLWLCGRMYLRMLHLSRQIRELREKSWERRKARLRGWLADEP
jgi:hypothetical protein